MIRTTNALKCWFTKLSDLIHQILLSRITMLPSFLLLGYHLITPDRDTSNLTEYWQMFLAPGTVRQERIILFGKTGFLGMPWVCIACRSGSLFELSRCSRLEAEQSTPHVVLIQLRTRRSSRPPLKFVADPKEFV